MSNNYGDPVWLAEVLRAAGLQVEELDGCYNRGHGDFGTIWGIIDHHTGNSPPTNNPWAIAEHPDLGLCSQLHLSRSGVFTVCGVGIAYHAGLGSWPGIPDDSANYYTIGIEAENNGTEGWSDAQYDAYVRGCAAILRHMGYASDRTIGHKEWAGEEQGKWDPGDIDMPVFRRQVQDEIEAKPEDGEWDMGYQEEILNQETGSTQLGEFPGWPARRHGLRDEEQPRFSQTDFARELDRELNSVFDLKDAPSGDEGTLVGQVLALRKEVRRLTELLTDVEEPGGPRRIFNKLRHEK